MFLLEKYQHKKDYQLFGQLLQKKIVEDLFGWCRTNHLDDAYQYAYQASCLNITAQSVPEIYRLVEKASCEFGLCKVPKCYLVRNYEIKVEIIGIFEPALLVSSDYINSGGMERLYGALAAQTAGIAAEHYKGLALSWIFDACAGLLPVPQAALTAVKALLNEWKRCRWYTCDRAFLLATGNYQMALESLFERNVPMDILKRFQLGTDQDAYQAQVQRFMKKDTPSKIANLAHSLQSDTAWIPQRYWELQRFHFKNEEGVMQKGG